MENPVTLFVKHLHHSENKPFSRLDQRQYAGVSFLYVELVPTAGRGEFESFVEKEAARFIEGTAWMIVFSFVRRSRLGLIYRCQLRVPDEKSFCCGNQCPNCIL